MSEFKVGGYVLCISGDNRLFTIRDDYGDFLTLICGNPKELYKYPKNWFRIAKPNEIKAGRRL